VGENDAPSNYRIEKSCQLLDICVTMVDCLKQETLVSTFCICPSLMLLHVHGIVVILSVFPSMLSIPPQG
jgi:hypothetical protein